MHVSLRRFALTVAISLTAIINGCVPQPRTSTPSSTPTTNATPRADDGPTTARHLQKRYDERVTDCGGPGTPAFMCSGIIIRGTAKSDGTFHTWDPSPKDQARHAISASWLRSDAPFHNLWRYPNGIVFFPNEFLPRGTDKIYVLCTFPFDGATDLRPGGCGAHPNNPGKSGPCQRLGISNAVQWFTAWQSNRGLPQCGFEVSSGTSNSAAIFMQIPVLMVMINGNPEYNEIVLQAWSPGAPTKRPIEAFFYLYGDAVGKANAQYDQKDFHAQAGVVVPIIRIRLPVNGHGATFDFIPADQVVTAPEKQTPPADRGRL